MCCKPTETFILNMWTFKSLWRMPACEIFYWLELKNIHLDISCITQILATARIPVHVTNFPIKFVQRYVMSNSIVRTNCSIITRSPTGSSLTPTCPGSCLVLQVTEFPIIYYGMTTSMVRNELYNYTTGSLATIIMKLENWDAATCRALS